VVQDQGLRQVVRALQEAQEQVLVLVQEQARVLGLAAELVQGLVLAQVSAQQELVLAEAQVEVLEPGWAQVEE
jgi:predicted GTPase